MKLAKADSARTPNNIIAESIRTSATTALCVVIPYLSIAYLCVGWAIKGFLSGFLDQELVKVS